MRETDGVYFRPLLKIPKPQLKEWAIAHAIAWREDISNASQEFERNRIRNDIIPITRTLNPEVEQAI